MGEHIHVTGWGVFLGKKRERLVLKEKGETVRELPFYEVDEVTIDSRGVSFSSDAIYRLAEEGVQVNFLTYTGKPYAKIIAPGLSATVKTRRQQLLAFNDHRGVEVAKCIVLGKLVNQANTLKYFSKSRRETQVYEDIQDLARHIQLLTREVEEIEASRIDDVRNMLMNIEGRAGRRYWVGVSSILEDKIDFPGRMHQGAEDPLNSVLNYGYGILHSRVMGAVLLAGLEPYAGFLHVDRPGKPSMVLDLIEEFRQSCVDRPVIAAFSRGATVDIDEDGLMDEESRRKAAQWVLQRLDKREKYEGKKYTLNSIIQKQVRRAAAFFRKDRTYTPYRCKW